MQALLDSFRDPLFLLFPVATSAVSMAAFVVFAVPLTLLAWRDPPSMRRYRIQSRRRPAKDDARQIVWPSVGHWLRNNLLTLVLMSAIFPLLRLSKVHAGPLPPWYEVAWQLVFFVYLDDFLYYFVHRAMHWKPLYRRVHIVHHRMPAPWACAAHYMHPAEFLATGFLMLLGPHALGSHVVTLWLWVVFQQWEAAEGHCGYRLPWNPSYLWPGYGGNEYHDFHHAKFLGNYAGFLGWVDRLFETYSPGYLEYRADVRAGLGAAPAADDGPAG